MRLASLLAVIAPLVPLAACSSDGHSGDDTVAHCEQETTKDDFVVGLTKAGEQGLLNFKLIDFSPAPPARLLNTWTVEITSAATVAPMSNAALDVSPFMPAHGHGAGIDVVVTPMPTAGDYKLDDINLHMPGLWEVTITAMTDAGTDDVVFRPCIPN